MLFSTHRPGASIARTVRFILLTAILFVNCYCSKNAAPPTPADPQKGPVISSWITTANQSMLLQQQSTALQFSSATENRTTLTVDSAQRFQEVEGFGYTLTGGSALLINRLPAAAKAALLQELFGTGAGSIGVSYLRLGIGASDLSPSVFSYNDLPAGETDPDLTRFSLSEDTVDLIPLLKQILNINPGITLLGSPWSPPVWMKDNNSSIGGSLLPQYYGAYARYFVKYIQAMQAQGIRIHAVTIQNEPQHGGNNPSMVMSASQQAEFIRNHLGPAFRDAGISTRIIIWDHNCNNPGYPISILNDPAAKAFIDGSAFHLYEGDISALSTVRNAHPDRNLYFTEQWTGANGSFSGDLQWHIKNVIIGSMRNYSRIALEWNLANDPNYDPHTPGGCTECKGALTVNGASISRNVAYYIIAHASRFVPKGSVRIASTEVGKLASVAFVTPAGNKVLIVLNEDAAAATFNIRYKGLQAAANLPGNAVATYTWQ